MNNTPTLSIAHLLGRASPSEKAKIAKLRKQKQASDRGVAESTAARAARSADFKTNIAVLMEKPAAAAKKSAAKSPPKAAPAKTVKRKAAAASRYAHLQPAEYVAEVDDAPVGVQAKAIVASAAKARSAIPVTKPAKGTAAAAILAAGRAARTPTGTGAAKPTGLAAKIIAAGRKRRGGI